MSYAASAALVTTAVAAAPQPAHSRTGASSASDILHQLQSRRSPRSHRSCQAIGSTRRRHAATCANACSTNCAIISSNSSCTRTATENPRSKLSPTPSPSSTSICAPCRTSNTKKSPAPWPSGRSRAAGARLHSHPRSASRTALQQNPASPH